MVRITIILDDPIAKKIRQIQGQRIIKSGKPLSFSALISELLKEAIKLH